MGPSGGSRRAQRPKGRGPLGAAELRPFWDDVLGPLEPATPPVHEERRLIHNDLDIEHLLLDPSTGSLVGIIDFADAERGDRARDFTLFVYRFDRWFFDRMLERYDLAIDPGCWERAWQIAHVDAPYRLADAVLAGNREEVDRHLAAVARHAARPRP